jgi:16S rRNA (adenine(1408)-N(1))-methyltransferase
MYALLFELMRLVSGNKIIEISKDEFTQKYSSFNKCVIDLGTGDGRFVYDRAQEDPSTLYIGIDPAQNQLKEFSSKANRKRLDNVIFVIASVELLPEDLHGIADQIFIILPWGSLLEKVVKPTSDFLNSLKILLKSQGEIALVFGYSTQLEPSETDRLGLKELNQVKIEQEIVPLYSLYGFTCDRVVRVTSEFLANLGTSWSKNIVSTVERPLFMMILKKIS